MKGRAFYDAVHADPELEWLGVRADAPALGYDEQFRVRPQHIALVRNASGGLMALAIDEIKRHAWETLRAVLLQERPGFTMKHVTRIVGYYSFVRASAGVLWNRSKLSELADRRNGNYTVAA
jgi:hypothetical protein